MKIVETAALLSIAVAASVALAEDLNRIVLRVNDQISTLADFDERRSARVEAISRAGELGAEERRKLVGEAGMATMREIFEELLVMSRAQQLRLEASPSEIDRAVDSARRRFGIDSDAQFEQELVRSGSSVEQFRARMARNIVFNEVLQREIQPRIKIDDEVVARYWREHPQEFALPERRRVEEAVVRDGEGTLEERRALATALRDALGAGKSVAEAVAAANAAERVLVLDHEWVERGALDAALETTVWELGASGVGGPLEGRGGLHVVRVNEIQPASVKSLELVRPQIQQRLQEQEFEIQSRQFLEELGRKAFVVEQIPPEAAGYRTAETGERDPVRLLLRGATERSRAPETAAPEPVAPTSPPTP